MPEVIGIIAAILELAAIWLVGSKNRLGFACGLGCNVSWIAYVFMTGHTYGLLLVTFGAIILNIRGLKKWKEDK